MPELQTYTASGKLNPVPQQGPSIEGAIRPYTALQGLGGTIGDTGTRLAMMARDRRVADEHKRKEDELTWASKAVSDFGRTVTARQLEDGKPENLRETEGDEFDSFSKEKLSEMLATAPSKRAAEIFRSRAQSISDNAWERASNRGENIRLQKAEQSNNESALNLSQAYRDLSSVYDPESAAAEIAPMMKFQIASIDERFGETAPTLAAKMRLAVVEEITMATAATNPDFARKVVESSRLTAETKLLLNNRIDSIQSSAMELERSRFMRTLEDHRTVAIKSGSNIAPLGDDEFKSRFGSRWQVVKEAYDADRKDINTANDLLRGLGSGANPIEQAKAANAALASGDPSKVKAAGTMRQQAAAAHKLATEDPVAWQEQYDPDIRLSMETLATLPEDAQAQFRSSIIYQRRDRQGVAPPGDPNPERYLGQDDWRAISAAEADDRKRKLNAATPDNRLKLLADLEAEFGDAYIANKVYSDMIELGDEKIPVSYRFAGIINNVQTRKEFVDAQKNAKAIDKLNDETRKNYTDVLDKPGGPWKQFVAGWYGQSGESAQDAVDAKAAMISYAMHLQAGNAGLSAKDATTQAVDKVIGENYGFAVVHGRTIPISKNRLFGGAPRTDLEIKDIERRLTIALRDVPVQEIEISSPLGTSLFPGLPANLDQKKPEDMQIVRDYVTRNGFWQMESSGEMVTLFVGDGGNFGFALRDKQGKPLKVKLDDLPSFVTAVPSFSMGGTSYRADSQSETYPIVTGESLWTKLGFNTESVKTNWPTRKTWMGKDFRNFGLE